MPNKTYQDNNYFSRPQCAQQTLTQQQQYHGYPINNIYNPQGQNVYDLLYPVRNQYTQNTSTHTFDQIDNTWLPDHRIESDIEKGLKFTDKIETIEISSKDLSPASCCSNIDLLLPDFYKNTNNQWYGYTNKNYIEYPSCSQVNCEQDGNEKTVKYCSIQKTNNYYDPNQYQYEPKECTIFNQDNSVNITDVFPQGVLQFDPVTALDQRTEISDESDIIVEESDDDATEYCEDVVRKFNCIVCNVIYSPIGNQFYFLTPESPLTMSSQKPVYLKLKNMLGKLNRNSYLCGQCLGLLNTIDHLEVKLEACRADLVLNYQKTNNVKVKTKKDTCRHKFHCKLCKKVFSLEGVYKNHTLMHKKVNRFLCEFCGRRFTKLIHFRLHYKRHKLNHAGRVIKIKAFLCKVCHKSFRTRSNLKEHENYCSGRLPFKCRHCNKKFATTTKLKNHVKLKHDKKFTSICSICNIGFVKVSDYKAHMISHSTDKKFSCTKCDKTYKTLSNLNFHMKFHNDKLPFICAVCGKGFMRKEYLEAHTSLHTGEKNFTCSICEKKFVSQKSLDVHLKMHDSNVDKKSCNICGKLISKGLEDHLRTHTNLKEFECDSCDMRFNTKSALLKHKKRKHNVIK